MADILLKNCRGILYVLILAVIFIVGILCTVAVQGDDGS